MFRHGCVPPSGAGADLLLSYAAFISLAGGSCTSLDPPFLIRLYESLSPFEIRSIINSVRSSCLPAFSWRTFNIFDRHFFQNLHPCSIRPFLSWLGSVVVVRLEALKELEELARFVFLNSIEVSEVLFSRWSPLALVPISSRFFLKARYSCVIADSTVAVVLALH